MNYIHRTRLIGAHGATIPASVSVLLLLMLSAGCGDPDAPPFYIGTGGSGGSGGSTGTGGIAGTGGTGGMGGTVGTGGTGGTGQTGGTSGTGGTGGSAEGCSTSALCAACPAQTCNTDSECASLPLPGLVCVPTGCTLDGEPQKECQPARYISCVGTGPGDCPDANYECKPVGSVSRCVRKMAGCTDFTEDYDCPLGFSCESGACVDRRVPCDGPADCPRNHVCLTPAGTSTSKFCVSSFRTCRVSELDCSFLGASCADVDDDGRAECTGERDGIACVNADCQHASDPVCELSASGTTATCGDHGLCESNADCDTTDGFECVALWQDGRKECVPAGGTCDHVTECPLQQVCAAPRNGGPPSCQAGKEAM